MNSKGPDSDMAVIIEISKSFTCHNSVNYDIIYNVELCCDLLEVGQFCPITSNMECYFRCTLVRSEAANESVKALPMPDIGNAKEIQIVGRKFWRIP